MLALVLKDVGGCDCRSFICQRFYGFYFSIGASRLIVLRSKS